MRGLIAGFVWVLIAASAPAVAQTADPVMEHYRAHLAALAVADHTTAETEAEAALAASEARDGDSGRTAVLALNLALARLRLDDGAGALDPARRAFALSESGAAGVDPAFAGLVLGRAEFASGFGAERLSASLTPPFLSQLPPDEIYVAASQLGLSAFAAGNYQTSELAWSAAAAYPSGAATGEQFGRGTALTLQAASIFYAEIGSRGRSTMNASRGQDAFRLAGEAVRTLGPLARAYELEGDVTPELRRFAQALTVRQIIRATMVSHGQQSPTDEEAEGDAAGYVTLSGPTPLAAPICGISFRRPDIRYPLHAARQGYFGTVTVLVRIRDERVASSEVLAWIGDDAFPEAVRRADWDQNLAVTRLPDAPPNCRIPASVVVPLWFYLH